MTPLVCALLSSCLFAFLPLQAAKPSQPKQSEFVRAMYALRAELVKATEDYQKSLDELLRIYEKDVEHRRQTLARIKKLEANGSLTQRDVERAEAELSESEQKVEGVRSRKKEGDRFLAEALKETPEELEKRLINQPKKRERTPAGRIYYVRFIVFGEAIIYDYSGAVTGRVIKQGPRVRYDSRNIKL